MASNKQRFNGNFENLGWGKRKDALNKPVTEKMSKDLNPSSSHKVSRPDPERIKNKKLGRDDSTKEESVDQLSLYRNLVGFSMKPDKIKDVLLFNFISCPPVINSCPVLLSSFPVLTHCHYHLS